MFLDYADSLRCGKASRRRCDVGLARGERHSTRLAGDRTKVRLAIEKIGYVPNEAARILKGTRSSVIGLIVPDLADPFFAELGHAVQQTAWDAGYMTLMAASGHREDLEISEDRADGASASRGSAAVSIGKNNQHFAEAQRAQARPVVAIDRPIQNVTSDTLAMVDNHNAARRATEHLIGHGHRQILCIADTDASRQSSSVSPAKARHAVCRTPAERSAWLAMAFPRLRFSIGRRWHVAHRGVFCGEQFGGDRRCARSTAARTWTMRRRIWR